MTERLLKEFRELARRLISLAGRDDDVRSVLREVAAEILGETSGEVRAPASESRPRLTLGQPMPSMSDRTADAVESRARSVEDTPSAVAARCRVRSAAARLAAERLRCESEGQPTPEGNEANDADTLRWADHFSNLFYWGNSSEGSPAPHVDRLDELAGCLEALASALELAGSERDRRGSLERLLPLVAESQSALRKAFQNLGETDDPDQVEAFEWVKEAAARHRVYLPRYLRAQDLADPAGWPDVLSRLEALSGHDSRARKVIARLELLQNERQAIRDGRGTDADALALIRAVGELVGQGIPPSQREIREFVLPLIDDLPQDDLPDSFRSVLAEIDRYLATRENRQGSRFGSGLSDEILRAARLLRGKAIVLIGGLRHPRTQRELESALGLSELVWVATREHQSVRTLEAPIARPDVAVVLLAIRWASHSFGEIRVYCDRYQKPLVRLPGGYNPNQVAAQILAQCSDRLLDGGGKPTEDNQPPGPADALS